MARVVPKGGTGDSVRLADVKGLWDWEIHCLILLSLFLQAFLFLFAHMRQRSSSSILRIVLWLAYLSADSVAIFVLGHLAVHASEPGHQLMSFWAPFVLVHLGGQDTITAFSKQDNELWTRHLLNLVTQVAVAGYVVAKASWPDRRLKASMVIMFLSGCFKYAERTLCLYFASPAMVRIYSIKRLSLFMQQIREHDHPDGLNEMRKTLNEMRKTLAMMSTARPTVSMDYDESVIEHLMSLDTPINTKGTVLVADQLSIILEEFLSNENRCRAYEYVGTCLEHCYQILYTKFPLRTLLHYACCDAFRALTREPFNVRPVVIIPAIPYSLFHYVSTLIALVLFTYSEKEDPLHIHTSRADITVSYILIIAAIALDVSSAIMCHVIPNLPSSIILRITNYIQPYLPSSIILRITNYIQPPCCPRKWSEKIAQYSMINRHIVQDTTGMASIRQWIGRQLGSWGVGLLDVKETPITKDQVPIKEFILDNLLQFGERKQWAVASSRGRLALKKWIDTHQDAECSQRAGKALEKSIGVDFPTSVLIWHMATDFCYYFGDSSTDSDQTKTDKQMSRELSNYIMYLVFKCGVMLSANSQIVHDKAHVEISEHLLQDTLGEKDAIKKLFGEMKNRLPDYLEMIEMQKKPEEEPAADADYNAAKSNLKELVKTAEALDTPVLPRVCDLAQALISINDETDRWRLIVEVWSEMLFYIAPRCGGAFHYEHLSTGGEFITHVLLLMYFLGPFLPPPGAGAS